MGWTLGNTFVRTTDQGAVVRSMCALMNVPVENCFIAGQSPELLPLQAKGRPAGCFVSPGLNGWVGVFEKKIEGVRDLSPSIACHLSEALHTAAMSFALAPGGFLSYCLAENGAVRDQYEYFWDPIEREAVSYHLGKDLSGNPDVVASAIHRPEAASLLETALRDESLDSTEVLESIANALGISNWHVSHRYIEGRTSVDGVDGWAEFVVIPLG